MYDDRVLYHSNMRPRTKVSRYRDIMRDGKSFDREFIALVAPVILE
jgi:hypothetical protein